MNICEDIWYPAGPTKTQALAGAQLVVNISASPYHAGKGAARERMLATRAADNVVVMAFCNQVGGQDELVFDGGSVVVDVDLNANASGFGAGFVTDTYYFGDCMNGSSFTRGTRLYLSTDGTCIGSINDLDPGIPFDYFDAPDDNQDRGALITAMQPFRVCAIGVEVDLELPQTITANICASVRFLRYGLTTSGASVCQIKTFAATERDSAPLTRMALAITQAIPLTIFCIIPK